MQASAQATMSDKSRAEWNVWSKLGGCDLDETVREPVDQTLDLMLVSSVHHRPGVRMQACL
jgi:hypothetical protein